METLLIERPLFPEKGIILLCEMIHHRIGNDYMVRIWISFYYCCSVTELCLTLCTPMNCSPPNSSVHGISQARILEWVAMFFSRGSFWIRDWIRISCIGRRILYHWATCETPHCPIPVDYCSCCCYDLPSEPLDQWAFLSILKCKMVPFPWDPCTSN